MLNFKNQTKNQNIIKALIQGKQVQCKLPNEDWDDYNLDDYDNFGPWYCTDEYLWRIKPETKEITVEVISTKTLTLEGVKDYRYKVGEQVYFIEKHLDGCYRKYKHVPIYDNNEDFKNKLIFFETEEAMNKAYEQITNAQKGL